MERTDADLLDAWRRGDRCAGEALMRRHYRTVLRFFDLNASWAADDLTQRTLLACVEHAHQIRDASAFRAFLLGVARRQLVMYLREVARDRALARFVDPRAAERRGDDGPRASVFAAAAAAGPGPGMGMGLGRVTRLSTLVARRREQMLAMQALAAMPRAAQALLILYYWEGVGTPQLAESFAVPQSTIRTRLSRARDLLRHRMARLSHPRPIASPDASDLRTLLESLVAPPQGHLGGA